MAFFGGDSGSFFTDPQSMALLGALAGAGQYAGASRLPVTFGQVLGGTASGLLAGNEAAQKYQLGQQALTQAAMQNFNALQAIRQQVGLPAFGGQTPSYQDILSRKYQGPDWAALFRGMQGPSAAPQMPGQAQPNAQGSSLPPMGAPEALAPEGAVSPASGAGASFGIGGALPMAAAQAAQKYKIDPGFFTALINGESRFNPLALGPGTTGSGEPQERPIGLGQLKPSTARELGVNPWNAAENLDGSARYFAEQLAKNDGDYVKATQAYGTIPGDLGKMDANQRAVHDAALRANQDVRVAQNTATSPMTATDAGPQTNPFPQVSSPLDALQKFALLQARYNAMHIQMPPYLQSYFSAAMLPPGPQQDLAMTAAYKAAGLQLPQGALMGPNGNIVMPPGAENAIAAASRAAAEGKLPADIALKRSGFTTTRGPGSSIFDPLSGKTVYTAPMSRNVVDAQGNERQEWFYPPGSPNAPAGGAIGGGAAANMSGSAVSGGNAGPIVKLSPEREKELAGVGNEASKTREENIDAATAAQAQQASLQNLKADAANFYTGPFAERYQQALSLLRLINPNFTGQVASYEDFNKNAGALIRQAVREQSPRAAVQEFRLITEQLPNPEMSPQGLNRVIDELMGINDYRIAKSQAQHQWEQRPGSAGVGDVSGFETDWQANVSPYAFIFQRMEPAYRRELASQVGQSKEGRTELQKLRGQMQYIMQSGLDKYL